MSVTLELDQVRQKITAYENLSKELYATQVHATPLLQNVVQFLDQALVESKKREKESEALSVLLEAMEQVKVACQRTSQEFKSSGDVCRGKAEAYGEILASHNASLPESKNPSQSENL